MLGHLQVVERGQSAFGLDDLVAGAIVGENLCDERGVLLIAEGVKITNELIENLRRRGVTMLYRAGGQPNRGRSAARQPAQPRPRSQVSDSYSGLSSNYSPQKVERVKHQFDAGKRAVSYLCQAIKRSGSTNLGRTDACVEQYVNELVDDPDPVVANALSYEADLELAQRCVQFSVLSLAIGQQMNLSIEQLGHLGSAAIVHDWSLFELPAESRFPHQPMTDEVRAEYLRHPIATVQILNEIQDVPAEVKLFVSQVHEYLDGSGFPRKSKADQLHPLSRILCVADAYLTMTSPPKGCPRIIPCDAIAYLINGASQGRYSPKAVTGLLQAVTLYPIGSIVELSDATKARVIRGNGKDYGFPIVESLMDATRIINLKDSDIFVARPIAVPEYHEVRLPETSKELNDAIRSM